MSGEARGHRYAGSLTPVDRARHFNLGGTSGTTRSSGTTTATARALEPEEKDLLKTQNEVLRVELDQITRQNESLAEIFPEAKAILQNLTTQTSKVVDVFGQAVTALGADVAGEREFKAVSEAEALRTVRGEAPLVTTQEQELIDRIFDTERRRGIQDITRIGQEAAAARGLRLTDTPIGSEVVRGIREFSEGLGAEKAKTTLDVGRSGQQFREAVRQFQEGLRFQAQQNRLALTGQSPFALSAPISTVSPAQASAGVTGALGALINRPVSTETVGRGGFGTSTWGVNILGGYSTVRVKKNILPLDPQEFERITSTRGLPLEAAAPATRLPLARDDYDGALDRLKATPIVRYRYRWERDGDRAPHIGPLLELSPPEIREDDHHVNLLDFIGLNTAGLKAVERRVTRLEVGGAR